MLKKSIGLFILIGQVDESILTSVFLCVVDWPAFSEPTAWPAFIIIFFSET